MAFEDNIGAYSQEHFTIIEIDLPVVVGTCTLGGSAGFGTPLTCDQTTNGLFTHKFTTASAPMLNQSNIWRCIASIAETPTELQSGRGLASRGTLSVKFNDFVGDPNPLAPGVDQAVKKQGTFFGKLDARNIMQNREIRIKNYRVVNGQLPNLDTDAQIRYYIIDSLSTDGRGGWSVRAKDELSRVDIGEKEWPIQWGGFLNGNILSSTTTFAVDEIAPYTTNSVIRVGDELMTVLTATSPQAPGATLTVRSRGAVVGVPQFSTNISKTESPSARSAGEEIFLCEIFDGANIADVLYKVLTDIGIDPVYIPLADWYAEIAEWHSSTLVYALYTEAMDANKVITQILQSYLLDMWFDPVARQIKLSAISVWRGSSVSLSEGKQIDFDTVRRRESDDLRATNAVVVYDKPFKARDDATENFIKASIYSDPKLETDAFYGEPKPKLFDNNPIINKTAGDLLVQRYVSRYGVTPQSYQWTTQEKFLTFETGNVVDLTTFGKQSFSGLPATSQRAQIISVRPNYNGVGRDYSVKALTYEPAFATGTEIVITGSLTNVDLYNQFAGAPGTAVTLTFVLDGVTSGSTAFNIASIRAGNFPAGSKLVIILANGADLQAKGGKGGRAGGAFFDREFGIYEQQPPLDGLAGGVVFDCEGVDCDFYFSGTTPSVAYPEAAGSLRAPGGGGGATPANVPTSTGNSGGGGAGRLVGEGGDVDNPLNELPLGEQGLSGNDSGNGGAGGAGAGSGGGWGLPGTNSASLGGAAGSGIISGGATVQLFGDTPTRYISGNGDV